MGKLQGALHKIDPVDRAVSRAVGLDFAPKPKTPPVVVPMPDEQAIVAAKKKAAATSLGRTGRASTILSDATDRLGP
jgi:hypothetical protein